VLIEWVETRKKSFSGKEYLNKKCSEPGDRTKNKPIRQNKKEEPSI